MKIINKSETKLESTHGGFGGRKLFVAEILATNPKHIKGPSDLENLMRSKYAEPSK